MPDYTLSPLATGTSYAVTTTVVDRVTGHPVPTVRGHITQIGTGWIGVTSGLVLPVYCGPGTPHLYSTPHEAATAVLAHSCSAPHRSTRRRGKAAGPRPHGLDLAGMSPAVPDGDIPACQEVAS